ncbi:MAG: hypothetical protein ABJJ29_14755 [Nitratireductor sp.]
MNKLPVFASVGEVLSGVSRHYLQLVYASWPAILVLLLSFGAMNYLGADFYKASLADDQEAVKAAIEHLFSGGSGLGLIALLLLFMLASAVAAVRWHRFVLLGEGTRGGYGQIPALRGEDGSYVWTWIKVMLLYLLLILVFMILMVIGAGFARAVSGGEDLAGAAKAVLFLSITVVYLVVLTVFIRMMVALPDAAVGGRGRVIETFRRTKGNSWRLLGAFLLLLLTAFILMLVASFVMGALGMLGLAGTVIGGIVYAAAYLFSLMIQITMLSVAYREIIGLPEDPRSPEVTA